MKRYEVMAVQFDSTKIYGEDFDECMVELDYKPTLEELKSCYGRGLEFVRYFVISEIDEKGNCNEEKLEVR